MRQNLSLYGNTWKRRTWATWTSVPSSARIHWARDASIMGSILLPECFLPQRRNQAFMVRPGLLLGGVAEELLFPLPGDHRFPQDRYFAEPKGVVHAEEDGADLGRPDSVISHAAVGGLFKPVHPDSGRGGGDATGLPLRDD